jgi:hypothetical protein
MRFRLRLRLQYPPTPENAARHAQTAVDAARNVDGINLDFSPESLSEVDRIIGSFFNEGLGSNQVGETVFSFGCYVGEVFVRHQAGRWIKPKASLFRFGGSDLMIVELPNGVVCNPIGKAFKLLEQGASESVSYFYQAMVHGGAKS